MVLIQCTGSIEALVEQIETLWTEPSNYHAAYVSFGSKSNVPYQQFHYPPEIRSTKYPSNAEFQMIPMFLRSRSILSNKSNKPNLIVIIDTFREEELQSNCTLLTKIMSESTAPMDILVFNHQLTQKSLKGIIKGLTLAWNQRNLPRSEQCFAISSDFPPPTKWRRRWKTGSRPPYKKCWTVRPTTGTVAAFTNGLVSPSSPTTSFTITKNITCTG